MKELLINPWSFDNYSVVRDSQGRATLKAKIMKAGKLRYKTPSGHIFYGNISLDELKKAGLTASMKPVTVKHPPGLLTPKDVTKYQEGMSTDGYAVEEIKGEQWLVGPLLLQSEKAIETAESGEVGVSTGYARKAVPTSEKGVFDFTDIDINHIAIGCSNPRAEGAGLSLDEAEDDSARMYSFAKTAKPQKQEVSIMKQKLNAVKVGDYSLDEAPIEYDEGGKGAEETVLTFQRRENSLVTQLGKVQESMDSAEIASGEKIGELTGANTILTEQNEALKKQVGEMVSVDDIDELVNSLAEVHEVAELNGVEGKFKTETEGIKAIVDKVSPGHSLDDSELRGAYAVIKGNPKDAKEMRKSKEALSKLKNEGGSLDSKGKKVSITQVDIVAMRKRREQKRSA